MQTLNSDLKLELSRYLFKTNIAVWLKLFEIDKDFHAYQLYILRLNREINDMKFTVKYEKHERLPDETIEFDISKFPNVRLPRYYNDIDDVFNMRLPRYYNDVKYILCTLSQLTYPIDLQYVDQQLSVTYIRCKFSGKYADYNTVIKIMIDNDKFDMVKLIEPYNTDKDYVDIIKNNIRNAKIVKFLATRSSNKNFVREINIAANIGRMDIVKLLAKLSSNKNFSHAIDVAKIHNLPALVGMLQILS